MTPESATILIILYILVATIIDIYIYYHGLAWFDSFDDARIFWSGYWYEARKYARGIPRDKLRKIWRKNTLLMLVFHLLLIAIFATLYYGYIGLFSLSYILVYPFVYMAVLFYTIENLRKEYIIQKEGIEEYIREENPQFKWENL
jgi:hypothetical protein